MMVTLSVTRSRVATVLTTAAQRFEEDGWDPYLNPLMGAIDDAAGYVPGKGTPDAEETCLAAWDTLCAHLDGQWAGDWERKPGRKQDDVIAALRGAAAKAAVS